MNKEKALLTLCLIICVVSICITVINVIQIKRPADSGSKINDIKYDTEPGITSVEGIINGIKMTEAKLDTNRINFGKVAQDTILRAEFNIDNIGKEPLYLLNINPDCRCTRYDYDKKIAQAGEKIKVILTIDTKGKIGKEKIYSTMTLNTLTKNYKLLVEAEIE